MWRSTEARPACFRVQILRNQAKVAVIGKIRPHAQAQIAPALGDILTNRLSARIAQAGEGCRNILAAARLHIEVIAREVLRGDVDWFIRADKVDLISRAQALQGLFTFSEQSSQPAGPR